MRSFNIFLTGVGGQGIGLLSEVIVRAVDYSGQRVIGVDTHGLAQRGGTVSSHIRVGGAHSPLIKKHDADLILALERHEAARAIASYAKIGTTVVYYNTSWQPLDVRLGKDKEITEDEIEIANDSNLRILKVNEELEDVRMQNIVLLRTVDENQLIPGVTTESYLLAMADLMTGIIFERNRSLFLKR